MKTQLGVLFVTAVLIAGSSITPSFAQVGPVMVSTDKDSYSDGDTIVVSGVVSDLLTGIPITLRVIAANGNHVQLAQLDVGDDRKFSTELSAGGPLWASSGTYTVELKYGAAVAESTFEFGGSTGMPPGGGAGTGTGQMFEVDAGEAGSFAVGYSITGGSLSNISIDGESNSLVVEIDAADDGELTLTLPREMIDARMSGCEGSDDEFVVLVDAEETEFEEAKTSEDRTITIGFFAGAEEIEVIGTCAVPEFGTIAALILAVAIISIIAVSARSRLSIMPKY